MAAPMDENIESVHFYQMGLDDRLLKAICLQGWKEPTLIQEKAIPLALYGKDILARARTGSGKTAAFAIPVIQKVLEAKQTATEQLTRALVLTPTRELCSQAHTNFKILTTNCSREVKCLDVSGHASLEAQKPLLQSCPDILIGTPSRILAHLKAGNLDLKSSLQLLVIDEADLVFSFGYEQDVKALLSHLPQIYQALLMSATMTDDVITLKKLVLHNAVVLKLEESQLPETSRLTQYHIKCEEEEKFVLIYALFKLRLIRGKTIVFVNDVNKCYRLKLFLEQFAIRSCVLNSELPINSRCHMVSQFNDGVYEIIISADEKMLDDSALRAAKSKDRGKPRKTRSRRDKESGVTRGIDFQFVSNVINFDFPVDVDSYIHRVGRTARGTNQGTALSFVSMAEQPLLEKVETVVADNSEEGVFKPYRFKMDEIDGFRYRALDAMRAVTKVAVREARLKEIKNEIINSSKLKSYFEENPRDLELLRHDKALHTVRVQEHLKNVPDYLVPPTLRGVKRRDPQRKRLPAAGRGRGGNRGGRSQGQMRYQDAMRAVTKVAVREARLKEIKNEIINLSKLKSYFEENPRDLELLRHDKALHTVRVQEHLKNVPDYLVPPTLRGVKRRDPQRKRLPAAGRGRGGNRGGRSQGQMRYQDAMRAVTKVAVREARLKEIKNEIINLSKLKSYFEENPRDLELLRHDKALHTVRVQEHLKNVPDYLVPPTLRGVKRRDPQRKRLPAAGRGRGGNRGGRSQGQMRYQKRKADPLQSFEVGDVGMKRKT